MKPKSAKIGPYALDPLQIADTRIVLWSEWTEWSQCGYCDIVGRKFKIGYCKISLFENLPKSLQDTGKLKVELIQNCRGVVLNMG